MKTIKSTQFKEFAHELSSVDVQKLLMERAKNALLATAVELMEQDMAKLCGPRFGRKQEADLCHRGGSEETSLIVDGAKFSVRRPRARKNGAEVELSSLTKMRDQDLLDLAMQERILRGVSTRDYADVIGGFSEKTGISRSSVARAFKRASKKDLDAINGADLSIYKFVALLIDGTGVGSRCAVVAVGITDDNQKVPLGLKEGDTENASVVKDLLTSMISRGFTLATDKILAVLDGGKALRAAVKALWGNRVVIQRCWLHKLRNIQDYLPETNHSEVWRRMKKMMGLNSKTDAQKEFDSLASWLATLSFDAHKSLLEAGSELLTVHDLGITGEYRKSLSSTNIIESLMGVCKKKMRNVKNWKDHPKTKDTVTRDRALRWMATALQSHKPKMRRLRGGKDQIRMLINNLTLLDSSKMIA